MRAWVIRGGEGGSAVDRFVDERIIGLEYGGVGYVAGPLAWVLAIAISFLELLVQFLQAYVFTLLNAMYISGALADEH